MLTLRKLSYYQEEDSCNKHWSVQDYFKERVAVSYFQQNTIYAQYSIKIRIILEQIKGSVLHVPFSALLTLI